MLIEHLGLPADAVDRAVAILALLMRWRVLLVTILSISGFVWREARPGDKVCVTPDVRARTATENRAAASTRILPTLSL